jgi:arsenite-transporting ATPase
LRLLSLPAAWSGFLQTNTHGASCLGPHSALKTQQERYEATVRALGDGAQTTVVLVTRPEQGAVLEAERSSAELSAQGLANQWLLVNGTFRATLRDDEVALALEARGESVLAALPASLAALPRLEVPLYPDNMLGLDALRRFFAPDSQQAVSVGRDAIAAAAGGEALPLLSGLVDELAQQGHGLVMLMGKGGVGKTALAVALAGRGARAHQAVAQALHATA